MLALALPSFVCSSEPRGAPRLRGWSAADIALVSLQAPGGFAEMVAGAACPRSPLRLQTHAVQLVAQPLISGMKFPADIDGAVRVGCWKSPQLSQP